MAYFIRFLPKKKTHPVWKVQYISYRREDQRETSTAKEKKRAWDIPKERWRSLGFYPGLSLDEAKVRARQLNAQDLVKRQEIKLLKTQEKYDKIRLRNQAALPEEFVAEFEERFIRARGILTEEERKRRNRRRYVNWRAAQKAIVAIGLEPTDWFFHPDHFYDYFCKHKYSLGYIAGVIAMINLWGSFITRKLSQPFSHLRKPRGYEMQRLLEAYHQKKNKHRVPSASITPEHLEVMKADMNTPNFHWLYICVWFGLRPQELDQLHIKEFWKIEVLPTGRKILWVYQTKIIALPPEDRWEPIPVLFDEQHFALKIILDGNFRRPLTKTIKKYLGSGYDCYGGRKGFVDLMLAKGQTLENISIWMGHSTLGRTWRSYKNKRVYHG